MANCDRRKTRTFDTAAHCSDTVCTVSLLFFPCFHSYVLARPPLLVSKVNEDEDAQSAAPRRDLTNWR
jgi:hypothetical protein